MNANQDIKNYWIKAKGFADCSVKSVYQTAILNYENETASSIPLESSFNYSTMDRSGVVRKF